MGSGIFNARGIEQIRPLNRLRNSVSTTVNAATCSRCSSLLSLAASASRYSLNVAANSASAGFVNITAGGRSQQQQRCMSLHKATTPPPATHCCSAVLQRQRSVHNVSGNHVTVMKGQQQQQQQQQQQNPNDMMINGGGGDGDGGDGGGGGDANTITTNTNASSSSTTSQPPSPPPPPPPGVAAPNDIDDHVHHRPHHQHHQHRSRKSSDGSKSLLSVNGSLSPPSNVTTTTFTPDTSTSTPTTPTRQTTGADHPIISQLAGGGFPPPLINKCPLMATKKPIPFTSLLSMSSSTTSSTSSSSSSSSSSHTSSSMSSSSSSSSSSPSSSASSSSSLHEKAPIKSALSSAPSALSLGHADRHQTSKRKHRSKTTSTNVDDVSMAAVPTPTQSFAMFTCKLCLIDVESNSDATTLLQCGCKFCTECMKGYIEFEITEGAYEISCPDMQCPAQGVITLPEIADLTTVNLMKKHHRYRLNREIELDKTRTWCPRAGCETVCMVGTATTPTTSAAMDALRDSNDASTSVVQIVCAVQCPSCKNEFCSACKKTWHPNVSCEDNSRRLVADGQDDIGIPFDNDLIKCCPMCAVPIEKDEGCAQMMCKRCKHVFCWYCLASLDDDFLLRHYDKGPCKNKLGHSRASVVWHRAQVIGIFAGFGILLLVASPLLLLAAPCIICCKCRLCSSGSKVDETDVDMDETAALQR